jgi:hypothetical protein
MANQQVIESEITIVLGMHRAGSSQRAIAEQLGVTQSAVCQLLHKTLRGSPNMYIMRSTLTLIHRHNPTQTALYSFPRNTKLVVHDHISTTDHDSHRIAMRFRHITLQRSYQSPRSQCLQIDLRLSSQRGRHSKAHFSYKTSSHTSTHGSSYRIYCNLP